MLFRGPGRRDERDEARPRFFGLPGLGPYALVLTVLCLGLVVLAIVRRDPAGIVIALALVFVFVPLAVVTAFARRQGRSTGEEPTWMDELPGGDDDR